MKRRLTVDRNATPETTRLYQLGKKYHSYPFFYLFLSLHHSQGHQEPSQGSTLSYSPVSFPFPRLAQQWHESIGCHIPPIAMGRGDSQQHYLDSLGFFSSPSFAYAHSGLCNTTTHPLPTRWARAGVCLQTDSLDPFYSGLLCSWDWRFPSTMYLAHLFRAKGRSCIYWSCPYSIHFVHALSFLFRSFFYIQQSGFLG